MHRTGTSFTWERVGTAVGSNSSQWFGSIGTQTRPGAKKTKYCNRTRPRLAENSKKMAVNTSIKLQEVILSSMS